MAKSKRTQIKQDLLEQLERNCTVGEQYTDLVEDYLALWDTKKMLIKDIKTRGAVVEYESNTGTKKENVIEKLQHCDGAFVGTAFKKDGKFENFVEYARVKEFMDIVRAYRGES